MNSRLSETQVAIALSEVPPPKQIHPPLTAGRLVYLLYHYPKGVLEDGFAWHYQRWQGRRAMGPAMANLRPAHRPPGSPVAIHYLTGKNYVPLTTLALASAENHFGRPVDPVLYDDGTLDDRARSQFLRPFPQARCVGAATIEACLAQTLPEDRFPVLRRLRLSYLHVRKLTDIGVCEPDYKLVSDSDVFFFRPPAQLLAAVDGWRWFHMQDCQQSYGYSEAVLTELAGTPLHPRVNVGLCGIDGKGIDWEFVEWMAARLLGEHGFSYYLEQAITAVLMTRHAAEPLKTPDYLVYPTAPQAESQGHVALHYVDRSNLFIYCFGWRQVLDLREERRALVGAESPPTSAPESEDSPPRRTPPATKGAAGS